LIAVLEKRLGFKLGEYDAYVNVAGGMKILEPALDLGIVLALISSYRDIAVDEKTIVFGEVGLSGEVRAVSMAERRVAEAEKLGFERCIMPAVSMQGITKSSIKMVGIKNIHELIHLL
jgi:DNA repair protein RadA/Sms